MNKCIQSIITVCGLLLLVVSCASQNEAKRDIINDAFPEAQAEVLAALEQMTKDCIEGNLEELAAVHLISPKFSKFSSRKATRQTVDETIETETKHYGTITDFKADLNDVKIDVFGDVAIVTYIPFVSYIKNDQHIEGSKRVTLVFVKTIEGWKIVHEHGSLNK